MNTQQAFSDNLFRMNQSGVKRLKGTVICPKKYYLEEILKEHVRETSVYMNRGHYFEYGVFGTLPKGGEIPKAEEGRKKGSKSVIYERIDDQIKEFPLIMEAYGIKIIRTDYFTETQINNNLVVYSTKDALVEFEGRPYIMDLKLTSDVDSDFGDFAWGKFKDIDHRGIYIAKHNPDDPYAMDLIQAYTYMWDMEVKTRRRWGFLYAVFDYKAKGPGFKIIEVMHCDEGIQDAKDRFTESIEKQSMFEKMNYAPIPSKSECEKCKVIDCTSRFKIEDEFDIQSKPLDLPELEYDYGDEPKEFDPF